MIIIASLVSVGDFEVASFNRCLEHFGEKNRCCEGYSNINCKDNVGTTHCRTSQRITKTNK
jgi:hypothetical protein